MFSSHRAIVLTRPGVMLTSTFTRNIRIRSSSPEQNDRSGERRTGPSEEHAVNKQHGSASSMDTQAQQVQGSMRASQSERPAYVHGEVYKDDNMATSGTSTTGNNEEASPPSWWAAVKKRMGMTLSDKESKHGDQRGNVGH